ERQSREAPCPPGDDGRKRLDHLAPPPAPSPYPGACSARQRPPLSTLPTPEARGAACMTACHARSAPPDPTPAVSTEECAARRNLPRTVGFSRPGEAAPPP